MSLEEIVIHCTGSDVENKAKKPTHTHNLHPFFKNSYCPFNSYHIIYIFNIVVNNCTKSW